MNPPFFSVIICSINPWNFAQASTHFERLLREVPHEIIGIHDARSLCEGYNRGLQRARGDIVIFSHDDVIFFDPAFAQKIGERMQTWDILGFAGASRMVYPIWFAALDHLHGACAHWFLTSAQFFRLNIYGAKEWPVVGGIEVLDGLCMIVRHEVAASVGFDYVTFDGWHLYDCDFSFAAHLAGHKIGVCCDIPYVHASTSIRDAEHSFNSDSYTKYAERFIQKYRDRREMLSSFNEPAWTTSCYAQDHKCLKKLWTEDVFRRATVTIARQYTGEKPQ
jgi:GT2 family glycosyltransferase